MNNLFYLFVSPLKNVEMIETNISNLRVVIKTFASLRTSKLLIIRFF